jgi:hypothetical protein
MAKLSAMLIALCCALGVGTLGASSLHAQQPQNAVRVAGLLSDLAGDVQNAGRAIDIIDYALFLGGPT